MPQDLGVPAEQVASPGPPEARGQPLRGLMGDRAGVQRAAAASQLSEPCERAAIGVRLPRLPCNNSIEKVAFPAAAKRTAHALAVNVEDAVRRWGLDQSG